MSYLFSRIRYRFWIWLAARLNTNRFSLQISSAYYDGLDYGRREWIICPEGGGSNLRIFGTRKNAVKIASDMGTIRYVDNIGRFVVYSPVQHFKN